MNPPASDGAADACAVRSAPGRHRFALCAVLACAVAATLAGCTAVPHGGGAPDMAHAPTATAEPALVPRPAWLEPARGGFALRDALPLRLAGNDPDAAAVARLLAERVHATCGRQLVETSAADTAAVELRTGADAGSLPPLVDAAAFRREGYRLSVRSGGISMEATGSAGLRNGASTLLQLLCAEGAAQVPALNIVDAPRFAWRGLMLDSARHFQSPAFIHRLLEAMALHKLNVLHWHLTDDQAWRLPIRSWPKLAAVGGWRVPAGAAARADIDPATGQPRRIGGVYSHAEVRALVAHATQLGITVVPEIEMPGHASAALVAYPEFAATATPPTEVPSDWGIYPHAFGLHEASFAFLEDVLREVLELFPSPFIHVGGDEIAPDQWLASASGKARLRALGSTDPAALQAYFTARIGRFLASHGRRLVGWDEILSPQLPDGAVVMSWRGIDGAIAAARQGHDTVLAAWPVLYFDNRQSTAGAPPGRTRVASLQDVYAFAPLPDVLDASAQAHVLGLQGNIWTEHIRTEDRVWHMAFPRAVAVAELGWTPASRRDWQGFSQRIDALSPIWRRLGIAHATLDEAAADASTDTTAADRTATPEHRTRRWPSNALRLCSEHIGLLLEDDAPIDGPRAVFAVDIQNPCWILPAVDLSQVTAVSARVGQVPFNFQIGDAMHAIRFASPHTAAGELEVRLQDCAGELLARLPLAPATASQAVTALPPVAIEPRPGRHDLCLRFAQPSLEPLWLLDAIELQAQ